MKLASVIQHVATAAILSGCSDRDVIKGDGNITSEIRPISEFTSLQAAGALDIEWSSGAPTLKITTDENILSRIRTEVSGNTLKITYEGSLKPSKGIKIAVSSGAINQANLTGAVRLGVPHFTGDRLSVDATGANTMDVDGSVGDLTASLTGASQLKASGLNARTAKVTLVGASSADVAVDQALAANLTGASSLTYSGQVQAVEQHVAGASTIRRR
jgi:hypothetical protein